MRFSSSRTATGCTLALLCIFAPALPQDKAVSFFPGGVNFVPLRANHEEARVGLLQELGNSNIHVQIGNALDFVTWVWGTDTLGIGADFFAYALAATFGEYRFKIDAADGFFGIHMSYNHNPRWSARFRVLHYSAHLVDGRFDTDHSVWTQDRLPFPFSRNFGECTVAFRPSPLSPHRFYAGFGLSVFNRPRAIRAFTSHWGIELAVPSNPHWYCAYHGSLLGIPTYVVSNTLESGMKLGNWNGKGLRIYLAHFGGLAWYGQYYDERRDYFGAGIALDY